MEKIIEIRNKIEMKWEAIPYEKNVICRKNFFVCIKCMDNLCV